MSTRKLRSSALPAALVLTAATFGGCGGVRNNLTPELQSINERPADVSNRVALVYNTDHRLMWNDIAVLTLTDRPFRGSAVFIPH